LRERIVKVRDAAPASFAVGEFELITERLSDGVVVASSLSQKQLVQLGGTGEEKWAPREGRVPPTLQLCRACNGYVWPHETDCPHCGENLASSLLQFQDDSRRRHEAMEAVRALISKHKQDEAAILTPA
jgi:hypothetical protein